MTRKAEVKMLTVREVAERTGAAESSVRVWVWRGRFPGARKESTPLGDYWLIPESAIADFKMGTSGPKPKAKKSRSAKKGKQT